MSKEEKLSTRNSRKVYLPIYVMVLIILSVIIFIKYSEKELNPFALQAAIIFSLSMLGLTEIHRFNNLYEIDANALVHTRGILIKITRRTDLLAVSDADISQNPWQMMLGYGNVSARVFSKDSTMNIENISHPQKFVEFLEMKVNEKRNSGSGSSGSRNNR